MAKKYRLSIIANKILREVELTQDQGELVRIGTGKGCHVRFSKEYFFEEFELEAYRVGEEWKISCTQNTYMTADGVLKLQEIDLNHGDSLIVRYQNSGAEVLKASFLIDFESERLEYNRKINIASANEILIGGNSSCDIFLKDDLVGTDTFLLTRGEKGFVIKDNNTKYGIYLNGVKMERSSVLHDYDFVSIVGYSFFYKEGILSTQISQSTTIKKDYVVEDEIPKNSLQYPKFNKSTRIRYVVPEKEIVILPPEQLQKPPKKNILMSLIPALIMLAMTIVFRGIMGNGGSFVIFSVVSMSMGMIMSVITYFGDQKQYKKNTVERKVKYNQYIERKEEEIRQLRVQESEILEQENVSLQTDMEIIWAFDKRLFEKSKTDDDFLTIRVGTGEIEAQCKIKVTEQEFVNTEDELIFLPEQIEEKYHTLPLAPIAIPLKQMSAIGIVGSENQRYDFLKNITMDICARHYYKDVKLFYVFEGEEKEKFAWLRWMRHVNETYGNLHNFVFDEDSKKSIFEFLYLELTRRSETESKAEIDGPHYVVFVYKPFDILKHPISKFFEVAVNYGVIFLFFENYEERLPNCCERIIRIQENNRAEMVGRKNGNQIIALSYGTLTLSEVQRAAIKLSGITIDEISLESQLTKNITLFRLLGILNTDDIDLENRWKESKIYQSMAAPLGVNAKKDIVCLDLNEKHHGPHGLVAGTTGSGKSEILQSYILSMATLFHPYEAGFVIIDFKGGGMVNQFKDLPHLVGSITNIDGREIDRSLKSIKAELRKRQEAFAQSGVNHVDAYIKLYKKGEVTIPLPHLILIVDEFAELKNEQPEFMKELISAARIGRSLGVHLILATQKPSGVVDAQIWSNSKFKLCLKVQTPEDSKEVLKTPLAAEIKEPGRAYLQVGNNEMFELFQSAYSGAPVNSETMGGMRNFSISKVHFSGIQECIYRKVPPKGEEETVTQLDAIVTYVADYCKAKQIERLPGICLPSLEDCYHFTVNVNGDRESESINTIVPIGIYDDPDNQVQDKVHLDIMEGNTLVIGSSQYGKTAFLQTVIRGIAEQYSPKMVQMYILDFGSRALKLMEKLNHVGGVVIPGDDEKIKNLFRMLSQELVKRKNVFAQMGITSYFSYREAGNADIPHMVVCVDNIVAFKELYGEYDEDLLRLCREGIAVGISIIMTSLQTAGIGYKYLSNFSNKVCLYCNDSAEYGSVFEHCRMQPKMLPGRGIISMDKVYYEFQTFLAFEGEKEVERVANMKEFMQQRNQENFGIKAKTIPEVPDILNKEYVEQNFENRDLRPYQLPIGVDYEDVSFMVMDLLTVGHIALAGKEKSGKTNFIRVLMKYLQERIIECPAEVYIVDAYERKLQQVADECGIVEKYTLALEDIEEILEKFDACVSERLNKFQTGGRATLDEVPLLCLIVRGTGVYENGGMSAKSIELFKKITKVAKTLKILFVFMDMEDVPIPYAASELMKYLKENRNMFYFNNLNFHKIYDIPLQTLKKHKTPIAVGDAFYITNSNIMKIRTIKEEL